MKRNICNKFILLFAISSVLLSSCKKTLSREEATKLISEKYNFPYAEFKELKRPVIKIWTQDYDWNEGGWGHYGCKNQCVPPVALDDIIASGKHSCMDGFNTNSIEDWKRTYIATGDFDLYKKYKDMGIAQFRDFTMEKYNIEMDRNGVQTSTGWNPTGHYWRCNFSLTDKAKEMSIEKWQYKESDWVLEDIKGVFNNEQNKTADVEFTIMTANPTDNAKLFEEWVQKKENIKLSFKLYDDGWRIE